MHTDILLKRLLTFGFLRGLDQEALILLAKNAMWKVFPADAVVFWEGDTETNLYYLQYGSLKALKDSPEGREQVLRFISAGEIFNEVGALAKRPNPATAIGLEESGYGLARARLWKQSCWRTPRQHYKSLKIWWIKSSGWLRLPRTFP